MGRKPLTKPVIELISGAVLIVFGCCFVQVIYFGVLKLTPLQELALIRHAQVTTGTLTDSFEVEYDGEEAGQARGNVVDHGVYTFRAPDGREFKAHAAKAQII